MGRDSQFGFTKAAKPWLAVNPNYTRVNVQAEQDRPGSVLSFYREMIRLRGSKTALVFGSYRDISGTHPHVYSYVRADASGRLLVALNFSNDTIHFRLPSGLEVKRTIISNIAETEPSSSGKLRLSNLGNRLFSSRQPLATRLGVQPFTCCSTRRM